MTFPYTEEDVELVARALAHVHWVHARDDARAVLAALSSANRLVPPGSEVREEWRLRFDYLDGTTGQLRTSDEDEARSWVRNHRDCKHGTELASSRVITTPWSPSVPDTKEGS